MLMPHGPADARLMIVADCVSYRDIQSNTILNDREFDRLLSAAGINRTRCFVTALIRETVYMQDFDQLVAMKKDQITPAHKLLHNRYVKSPVLTGLDRLEADIDLIKPKIILAVGNGVLFALTGKWGIKSWRGSIIEYTSPGGHKCHIIPTYNQTYLNAIWRDRNVAIHDMRKAWEHAISDKALTPPEYNFIIEPSFGQAASILQNLLNQAEKGPIKLATDIETRGGHIACIGIAWTKLDALCIPLLRAVVTEMPNWQSRIHYWREEEEAYIMYRLYKLLTHPNVQVIGQNFIYDAQYFYRHLHYIPNFHRDTMITQHCMFNIMQKGLNFLATMYTEYPVYWKDESKNWDPKLGEKQLWSYNCKDCVVTYEVDEVEQTAIDRFVESGWPELRDVVNFQQSLFWPVLQTMITGVRVDPDFAVKYSEELGKALDERQKWLNEVTGQELNIRSPKQMADFFYRQCAQREVKKRSGKGLSVTCDDAALERISSREPLLLPVTKVISEMRSIGVFKSTFVEAEKDIDGRMRTLYAITGTKSYRFSSSQNAFDTGMNMQNIPKGDEDAEASTVALPNIRKSFIPDEGKVMFDIDLDSADLRIVVEESNCVAMRQMLEEGKKPYVEVAKEYYKDPSITKHHPAYKFFKAFCHGTHYLGTPEGMADAVNANLRQAGLPSFTVSELDTLQKWYFGFAPEIKDWHERITEQVHSQQYVQNAFGYRFWFFDRITKDVLNEAISLIPQSTVACVINRGYKNLYDNHSEIEVLLQVHDSLAGQFDKDDTNAVDNIRKSCSIVVPYRNPLIIPVGLVTSEVSWGDCG